MDIFDMLSSDFILLLLLPLHPAVFPAFLIPFLIKKNRREYENTQYYKITHLPFPKVKSDPGRYGEYLIYLKLKERVITATQMRSGRKKKNCHGKRQLNFSTAELSK